MWTHPTVWVNVSMKLVLRLIRPMMRVYIAAWIPG